MKKFALEALGTFFVTLSLVVTGNPFSVGLMLFVVTFLCITTSYAHFNPSVSFAAFLLKRISLREFLSCCLAQFIGASSASMIFALITAAPFTPDVISGLSPLLSGSIELMQTTLFCTVALCVLSKHTYAHRGLESLTIGLSLTALGFVGGIFNPAIGLAGAFSTFYHSRMMREFIEIFAIFVLVPLGASALASFAVPLVEKE